MINQYVVGGVIGIALALILHMRGQAYAYATKKKKKTTHHHRTPQQRQHIQVAHRQRKKQDVKHEHKVGEAVKRLDTAQHRFQQWKRQTPFSSGHEFFNVQPSQADIGGIHGIGGTTARSKPHLKSMPGNVFDPEKSEIPQSFPQDTIEGNRIVIHRPLSNV